MYINLSGLHVLLTGATHSIGHAIATKLGEAGATLTLQYYKKNKSAEELAHILSNDSRALQADLSDKKQLIAFFDKIIAEYSELEVLINNASQFVPSPLSATNEAWFENWTKNFALNLEASVYLCKRAIEHWRKKKIAGRIINISVLPPHITSTGEQLAYATAKAALKAFTHSLAQAVFADKIKIFTLMPPPLRNAEHLHFSKEAHSEQLNLAKPRDVAPMVAFLSSGLADYASGTVINMSHAQLQLSQTTHAK